MSTPDVRPRGKATIAVAVVVTVVVAFLVLWRGFSVKASAAAGGSVDDSATVLVRVGLSPDDLSTAGVRSASVAAVVADVEDYLTSNPGVVADADARVLSARDEAHALERLVRGGLGSAGDVRAYAAARSELDAALAARDAVLDAIFAAGTSSLSDAQRSVLTRLRSNVAVTRGIMSGLPLEFLAKDRSETDWVRLREALANERIAVRLGEEPDAAAQADLSSCRSESDVASARTNHETYLSEVETAWDEALGG